MTRVRLAVLYFLLVFAAGFVFGTARELVAVPLLGRDAAGLAEVPFMLVAIFAGAWLTMRRPGAPSTRAGALALGALSLALVLLAELALSPVVRGGVAAWFASFTPTTLASAILLWIAHAAAPAVVVRA